MRVLARVEWRSERLAYERPVALWLGGERVEVEVEDEWQEGPAIAGGPVSSVFVVHDTAGRRLRVAVERGGSTRVELL